MPPRSLVLRLAALVILASLAVVAACGGGDDTTNNASTGKLTDPQNVPTATPWPSQPAVVLLDPNNIQPLPPNQPNTGPTASPTPAAGEPGACGQTYTVVAGDTMFGIATKCGVDGQRLIDINPNADPSNLHIGDVLLLPDATVAPTEAPADTGEPTPEAT
ncbi:MAG: LysM domain-containing protein [Chloroflexota bacterium]